jgi:hypothetical protein
MQAQVQAAANRMVGELFTEELVAFLPAGGSDGVSEFADRLIRSELALIADGVDPLRVSLRIGVLTAARDALESWAAIRELPEAPASSSESTLKSRNQSREVRLADCARADGTRRRRAGDGK